MPGKDSVGKSPYEEYLAAHSFPVMEGIGFSSQEELPLADVQWGDVGAQGIALQLAGLQGLAGALLLEVSPGTRTKPTRCLYDQFIYVLRGSGTGTVIRGSKREEFDWTEGTVFSIEMGSKHSLAIDGTFPARLLTFSNAPLMMDLVGDRSVVHELDDKWLDHFADRRSYNQSSRGLSANGRATHEGNLLEYVGTAVLPVDSARGTGYGYLGLGMDAGPLGGHIGEFPKGTYAKAHSHFGGALLVCLSGTGYTTLWPSEFGVHPFARGYGERVSTSHYIHGGMVAIGTGWFHQHMNTGSQPLRMLALRYGHASSEPGSIGFLRQYLGSINVDMKLGGRTIEYKDEDPEIGRRYREIAVADVDA